MSNLPPLGRKEQQLSDAVSQALSAPDAKEQGVKKLIAKAIRVAPEGLTPLSILYASNCMNDHRLTRKIQRIMLEKLLHKDPNEVNLFEELAKQENVIQKTALFLELGPFLRPIDLPKAIDCARALPMEQIPLKERLVAFLSASTSEEDTQTRVIDAFLFPQDFRNCPSFEKRVELLSCIAFPYERLENSQLLAHFSEWGFLEDLDCCDTLEQKLERLQRIMPKNRYYKNNPIVAAFIQNFDILRRPFPAKERIALAEAILSLGTCDKEKLIATNISKFHFFDEVKQCSDRAERIKQLKELFQGKWVTILAFLESFSTFAPFSFEERLELAEEIAGSYFSLPEKMVRVLGFTEDLQACTRFEERIAYLQRMTKNDSLDAALINLFAELGFIVDLLSSEEEERLKRFLLLAKQGETGCHGILNSLKALEFTRFSLDERIAIVNQICETNAEAKPEKMISNQFEDLGFIEDFQSCQTPEEKFALALKLIGQKHPWGSVAFLENLPSLGLSEMGAPLQIELANHLERLWGYKAAGALGEKIKHFSVLESLKAYLDPDERIKKTLELVQNGVWSAVGIALHLELLDLGKAQENLRIQLASQIARKGDSPARKLARNFHELRFTEETPIAKLIPLVHLMGKREGGLDELAHNSNLNTVLRAQLSLEALSIQPTLYILTSRNEDLFHVLCMLRETTFQPKIHSQYLEKLGDIPKLAPLCALFKDAIKELVEKTKEEDKEYVHQELWKLSAYIAGVLYYQDSERVQALIEHPAWITAILSYRRPVLRYSLFRELSYLSKETIRALPAGTTSTNIRSLIFLSRLEALGILDSREKESLYASIGKKGFFKDEARQNALYEFFLISLGIEDNASIKRVLQELFPAKGVDKSSLNKLRTLNRIHDVFGEETFLHTIQHPEVPYQESFQIHLRELFTGLDAIPDLEERFDKTFGHFRGPNDIFTYLGRLKLLPPHEQPPILGALSQYVVSVLLGTFHDVRYQLEGHPHLQKIALEDPTTLLRWRASPEKKSLQLEGKNEQMTPQKILHFFQQKILTDQHLKDSHKFPLLTAYLQGVWLYPPLEKESPELEFQKLLMSLCKGKITIQEFLTSRPSIDLGELENDIQALYAKLTQRKISSLEIAETDDPCDLLRIGTEVQGSCQRIDGHPKLNKSLLGYLLNGEVRAIVIKDSSGKIVARAILRLLWSEGKPVLFLERSYSNIDDEKIKEALAAWAIQKAKAMQLPLLSKEVGSGNSYTKPVEFLGGRAPFTYSDAMRGSQKGPFTIKESHFLYSPPCHKQLL